MYSNSIICYEYYFWSWPQHNRNGNSSKIPTGECWKSAGCAHRVRIGWPTRNSNCARTCPDDSATRKSLCFQSAIRHSPEYLTATAISSISRKDQLQLQNPVNTVNGSVCHLESTVAQRLIRVEVDQSVLRRCSNRCRIRAAAKLAQNWIPQICPIVNLKCSSQYHAFCNNYNNPNI